MLTLAVRDEGVGIPAGELESILQPFRGGFEKGTGLGLSIVHRIVSDYGGELQVSSEPGAGTTVKVKLPLRSRSGSYGRGELNNGNRATTRRHRPQHRGVLVVDDERSMRELLSIVLRRDGHEVLLAENGAAAIDAAPPRTRGHARH